MSRMFCGKNHWSVECRRLATSTNNQNKERRCFICLSNKNLFEEELQQKQKQDLPNKVLTTDNNNTKEGIHRKSNRDTDDVVDVQPWCNAELSDTREELKLDSNLEMEEVGRRGRGLSLNLI